MSAAISSSLSIASAAAATPTPNTAATQRIQQPANTGGDTVKLTVAQQVYQLYNQGQTITQIANSLSLAVSAVNSYLNISSQQ
jgi:DNA-binding CsgD family transcriptional regulator